VLVGANYESDQPSPWFTQVPVERRRRRSGLHFYHGLEILLALIVGEQAQIDRIGQCFIPASVGCPWSPLSSALSGCRGWNWNFVYVDRCSIITDA